MSTRAVNDAIGTIWVVFWLGWFVAALGANRTRSRARSSLPIRALIVIVVVASIRGGVFKGHDSAVTSVSLHDIGFAVFLVGLALAVWARIFLGRNWGTPMSQRADPELVTTGPYRYVRHPIYSGILLAAIGTAIAISVYWLVIVVLLGGYFIYSAVVEERNMEHQFPEQYGVYKRSTKMLIPFLL